MWGFFFSMGQQPLLDQRLLIIEASRSHSGTPHCIRPLWSVISLTQRPLPDNTQHSQETDIHASSGIRTYITSTRTATDPRLNYLYTTGVKGGGAAVAQLVEAQTGRSRVRFPMVSLEFFIGIILSVALWP
jgi:hypothetical protein